jgi:hypothetical protein
MTEPMTSQGFPVISIWFHCIYPASFILSLRGGGMDRIPMAESIGIGWRFQSESSGGLRRNTQLRAKDRKSFLI